MINNKYIWLVTYTLLYIKHQIHKIKYKFAKVTFKIILLGDIMSYEKIGKKTFV